MKKALLSTAIATVLGSVSFGANAASIANGDTLNITAGGSAVTGCLAGALNSAGTSCTLGTAVNKTAQTGSFFRLGPPSNPNTLLVGNEGIVLGTTQLSSGSHPGVPNGSENPTIDAPWLFNGNTGMSGSTSNIDVISQTSLDFSGFNVTWNGIPFINMGGGFQDCGTAADSICVDNFGNDIAGTFDNGTQQAVIAITGNNYVLDYNAFVPQADASGFGGAPYLLHLEGSITHAPAVPVPAAVWLFGSGLLGLVGVARRKASV